MPGNYSEEEVDAIVADSMARIAKENEFHKRVAGEYRKAVWRPWLRLWIEEPADDLLE